MSSLHSGATVLFGAELRHLLALQAIARYGSFSRSADALGYTQSAVSQQIAALEKLTGQRLVYRSAGSPLVTLTKVGAVLAEHVEAVIARLAAARADVLAFAGDAVLRIGTFQSVGVRIFPRVMQTIVSGQDPLRVSLAESNSEEDLLELVGRGELDMAFTCLPVTDDTFAFKELMRDPFVLLAPCDSSVADQPTPLTLEAIAEQTLIGLGMCPEATIVERYFSRQGLNLDFVFRSSDNGTVLGLVAAGVGAALVPGLLVEPADSSTVALAIDPRIPVRQIAVAWHRDRQLTSAAETFVLAAAEACRDLESRPPGQALADVTK